MVERFGLFTIIVLGEVVIGIVDGLSQAEQDFVTIVTAVIGLIIGFGFWWMYFDVVGRRLPRAEGSAVADWMLSHLPITLSIAAAGAAMVSLIEHAHEPSMPAVTAWLLSGSVALGLVGLILASWALEDARRLPGAYRPLEVAMALGAVAALVVGWINPAPWLLAAMLAGILSVLWFVAIGEFLRAGAWAEVEPDAGAEGEGA